jgi:hypothetical protein
MDLKRHWRATAGSIRPRDGGSQATARYPPDLESWTVHTTPGALGDLVGPDLEYFVLARLERFAIRLTEPRLREIPAWRRLAEHATSVTIEDCLALGLGAEALVILEDVFGDLADAPPPVAASAPPLRTALADLERP